MLHRSSIAPACIGRRRQICFLALYAPAVNVKTGARVRPHALPLLSLAEHAVGDITAAQSDTYTAACVKEDDAESPEGVALFLLALCSWP